MGGGRRTTDGHIGRGTTPIGWTQVRNLRRLAKSCVTGWQNEKTRNPRALRGIYCQTRLLLCWTLAQSRKREAEKREREREHEVARPLQGVRQKAYSYGGNLDTAMDSTKDKANAASRSTEDTSQSLPRVAYYGPDLEIPVDVLMAAWPSCKSTETLRPLCEVK